MSKAAVVEIDETTETAKIPKPRKTIPYDVVEIRADGTMAPIAHDQTIADKKTGAALKGFDTAVKAKQWAKSNVDVSKFQANSVVGVLRMILRFKLVPPTEHPKNKLHML